MFISLCVAQEPGDPRGIHREMQALHSPQEPTYLGRNRLQYAQKSAVWVACLNWGESTERTRGGGIRSTGRSHGNWGFARWIISLSLSRVILTLPLLFSTYLFHPFTDKLSLQGAWVCSFTTLKHNWLWFPYPLTTHNCNLFWDSTSSHKNIWLPPSASKAHSWNPWLRARGWHMHDPPALGLSSGGLWVMCLWWGLG